MIHLGRQARSVTDFNVILTPYKMGSSCFLDLRRLIFFLYQNTKSLRLYCLCCTVLHGSQMVINQVSFKPTCSPIDLIMCRLSRILLPHERLASFLTGQVIYIFLKRVVA